MSDEITLDGQPVTPEKLQEAKNNCPKGQRIIEVSPGEFKTLTKMEG